jgi:hypothetical protein
MTQAAVRSSPSAAVSSEKPATPRKKRVTKKLPKEVQSEELMYIIDAAGVLVVKNQNNGESFVKEGFVEMEEFIKAISSINSPPINTGILAPEVRSFSRFTIENREFVTGIYEITPRVVNIRYRGRAGYVNFDLALPYVQFYITAEKNGDKYVFNIFSVSCTKTPLKSLDDKIYQLPLNNTYPEGRVCLGSMKLPDAKMTDFNAFCRAVVNSYFTSDFNGDVNPTPVAGVSDYQMWQTATKKDPNFIISEVNFVECGRSIKRILEDQQKGKS